MGVYIPNMEKPTSCAECFRILKCKAVPRWITADDSIPKGCPLIDIVRCEECKWYNPWHANHTNLDGNHCRYIDRPMKPTDFCSYGEPRESEYVAKD